MSVGRHVATALVLLIASSVAVINPTAGDPGGEDAADELQNADLLTAPGKYSGNLTPTGDADWYKVRGVDVDLVDVPVCFEATTDGSDALTHLDVTFDEERTQVVRGELNPNVNPGLGLATPSFSKAYTGFNPTDDDQSEGDYQLSVSLLDLDDLNGDASTGLDAPSLDSSEDPIQVPSPCFGGTLALNDTADAYTFHAENWQRLMLTFTNTGDTGLNATFYGPDGRSHGPFGPTGNDTVHEVPVNVTGDWELELTGSQSEENYLLGLGIVEDPEEEGEGCSPYCF